MINKVVRKIDKQGRHVILNITIKLYHKNSCMLETTAQTNSGKKNEGGMGKWN